jgi:hypothetical protein
VELPNVEFSDSLVKETSAQPAPAVTCAVAADAATVVPTAEVDAVSAYERLVHWANPRCFIATRRSTFSLLAQGFLPEDLRLVVPESPIRVTMKRRGVWHAVGYHVRRFVVDLDTGAVEVVYGHSALHDSRPGVSDVRVEMR